MIEKKSSFEIRISLKICYVSLKIYSFGGFDEIREECCWFQDSRSGICLISTLTSKMPVRCTEHQDLVGEKDERGKALSANVVKSAGKLPYFPSYPSDINRMTYIAGWQAHHHHQLYFLSLLL